MILMILVEYN